MEFNDYKMEFKCVHLWNKILLSNLKLFFGDVTTYVYNFHSIPKWLRNRFDCVGCADKLWRNEISIFKIRTKPDYFLYIAKPSDIV